MLSNQEVRELRRESVVEEERLPSVFNALSDPGRFSIFRLLMKEHNLCVTDIANIFGISVPAASQQLKVLELSGLVSRERRGQMICYRIKVADPLVKSIMRIMAGFTAMASRKYH